MAQGHFSAVEVEEVHQFNRLPLPKRPVVDPPRLIVQLEINRENLRKLYT